MLPSGCESKSGPCGALGTRDSLNLGGYGVELALKNMEYKAMDDSTVKKGKSCYALICIVLLDANSGIDAIISDSVSVILSA